MPERTQEVLLLGSCGTSASLALMGEKLRLRERFPKPGCTLESSGELLKIKPESLGVEPRGR